MANNMEKDNLLLLTLLKVVRETEYKGTMKIDGDKKHYHMDLLKDAGFIRFSNMDPEKPGQWSAGKSFLFLTNDGHDFLEASETSSWEKAVEAVKKQGFEIAKISTTLLFNLLMSIQEEDLDKGKLQLSDN